MKEGFIMEMKDREIEKLWSDFSNIPINSEEETEEQFLHFPMGTNKKDIYLWFDEQHSKGMAYLLYNYDFI